MAQSKPFSSVALILALLAIARQALASESLNPRLLEPSRYSQGSWKDVVPLRRKCQNAQTAAATDTTPKALCFERLSDIRKAAALTETAEEHSCAFRVPLL